MRREASRQWRILELVATRATSTRPPVTAPGPQAHGLRRPFPRLVLAIGPGFAFTHQRSHSRVAPGDFGQAGQRATGSPSSALWQRKLKSDLLDQGGWASGGHSITRNMKGQALIMIRGMSYRQQDARSPSIRTPHAVCHL